MPPQCCTLVKGIQNPKHHQDTWTFWSRWRKLLRCCRCWEFWFLDRAYRIWCAVISAFDDLGPGDLGPSEVISPGDLGPFEVISPGDLGPSEVISACVLSPMWACHNLTSTLHVRRSSQEISPGDLARSLAADTSPIPWIQQLTR